MGITYYGIINISMFGLILQVIYFLITFFY